MIDEKKLIEEIRKKIIPEKFGERCNALDVIYAMNNKLKPCPFCGNENILLFDKNKFYYKCSNCQFESRECDTKEEATRMWNLQTAICSQEIYMNESGGRR